VLACFFGEPDRRGLSVRKSSLSVCLSIASSILCSLTHSLDTLILMRFLQGLGDSPGGVAAMAVLKDCY
ncbi:hypothetical protein NAI34_10265, partial [Francisella tularensis subsp. holarctica]|nr:hypothetical protein [Francisella tularensis subsp. holarctica]